MQHYIDWMRKRLIHIHRVLAKQCAQLGQALRPVHDVLLFYSRGDKFKWNPVYQPLPQDGTSSR